MLPLLLLLLLMLPLLLLLLVLWWAGAAAFADDVDVAVGVMDVVCMRITTQVGAVRTMRLVCVLLVCVLDIRDKSSCCIPK